MLSKYNSSIPKRKSGENGGEIYHCFHVFSIFGENNIFSPDFHNIFSRGQISYFSTEKKVGMYGKITFSLPDFTIFSPGNRLLIFLQQPKGGKCGKIIYFY
jgi:hypothetical protein